MGSFLSNILGGVGGFFEPVEVIEAEEIQVSDAGQSSKTLLLAGAGTLAALLIAFYFLTKNSGE